MSKIPVILLKLAKRDVGAIADLIRLGCVAQGVRAAAFQHTCRTLADRVDAVSDGAA